jgi:glycosyltransferase involved in cell wall biosynthesis
MVFIDGCRFAEPVLMASVVDPRIAARSPAVSSFHVDEDSSPVGRVLHLFQTTNLGGMEQVTFRVMPHLEARGFSFRIATPRPFGLAVGEVRRFDRDARDFPYRGRFGWRDFGALRKHVRELASACSHIWITGTSAAALAAVRGLPQPKILSHHYAHYEGNLPSLRWRAFYELMCRDLDVVTYPSIMTRDEAVAIAPWLSGRAQVVRNGVDVHYHDEATLRTRRINARRSLGLPQDAFIVGNAGWLIRRKRFDVFLQVAARVRSQIPDSQFIICGGGEEESALKRLASDLGLGDCVRFLGWSTDLTLHYQSWDALLFNTDFDTLPSTPMEAAAEGCIVVASQTYSGLGELIVHGRTGYLFPTHDLDSLTESLLAIRREPKRAAQMRQQAAKKLRSEFSLDVAANFFTKFFSNRMFLKN